MTKAIQIAPNNQCVLDPIPMWVVKKYCRVLAPEITNIIELLFEEGIFPESHKHAVVRPWIKNPSLDSLDIRSFRPISNLSFISKLTERLVVNRFNELAGLYHLLPVCQSAYREHHSTEPAITIVQNDIVRAIDASEVSQLVLLDLSAAFDTVDHGILFEVLQNRFGVQDRALN